MKDLLLQMEVVSRSGDDPDTPSTAQGRQYSCMIDLSVQPS
jgi:hypothetical protein